jgi:integrase
MRRVDDARIETRTARAKLEPRQNPYYRALSPDLHLGYRKVPNGPGRWVKRTQVDGRYVNENLRTADGQFIVADDIAVADGTRVLDYRQAQQLALSAQASATGTDKMLDVRDALDRYEADLRQRGGEISNVARVRGHLPETFGATIVARLEARHFNAWAKALDAAQLEPATRNRINNALRAALNLAARNDRRIMSVWAWETALRALPNAVKARKMILSDQQVIGLVDAAYRVDPDFGIFTEVCAETGARPSQIGRLNVEDLQGTRLFVPRSRKGRVEKSIEQLPIAISADLALRLAAKAKGRAPEAPLLVMPKPDSNRWIQEWTEDGGRWGKSNHTRRFAEAVAQYDRALPKLPAGITLYALRHSSIVRALKAGTNVRIVAAWHDTSTKEIETHYARFITDHTEEFQRRSLLKRPNRSVVPAG